MHENISIEKDIKENFVHKNDFKFLLPVLVVIDRAWIFRVLARPGQDPILNPDPAGPGTGAGLFKIIKNN